MSKQIGFTLLESLITLVILSVMLIYAIPNYQQLQAKSQIQSIVAEWRQSYNYARQQAMKLQQTVSFCPSHDGVNCDLQSPADYHNGWIVYASNGLILLDYPGDSSLNYMKLSGNYSQLQFRPDGNLQGFVGATLSIANDTNESYLVINRGGRIDQR